MMTRREFLERAMKAGVAIGAGVLFGRPWPAYAAAQAAFPDLVAVKNGKPEDRFDRAMASLGGMARFVKKGASVVVKPNIGWDRPPEAAATTNPALVARVVARCLEAGASKVYVFDHTCDEWKACYKTSMIEKYAKEAGAIMAPASAREYYGTVTVKGAKTLTSVMVHELVAEADVFINMPVLKHHGGAGMTSAMKNLMGVVWDRGAFHSMGLDACIAESCLYRKPDLNVVDADRIMLSQGPRGNASSTYRAEKTLIVSPDCVAADVASARTMGQDPASFGYIALAAARGVGRKDLEKLKIERIAL